MVPDKSPLREVREMSQPLLMGAALKLSPPKVALHQHLLHHTTQLYLSSCWKGKSDLNIYARWITKWIWSKVMSVHFKFKKFVLSLTWTCQYCTWLWEVANKVLILMNESNLRPWSWISLAKKMSWINMSIEIELCLRQTTVHLNSCCDTFQMLSHVYFCFSMHVSVEHVQKNTVHFLLYLS